MKFHWRQYSGPATAVIEHPDRPMSAATGLTRIGTYGFELTVENAFGIGRDSFLVNITRGVLSINPDPVFHIQRPKITKLEIKSILRTGDILLQVKSPRKQKIKCIICDILGRAISQTDLPVEEGISYVSVPKPTTRGVYLLRFITYFESITLKVFI